jgi:hypothetical protein
MGDDQPQRTGQRLARGAMIDAKQMLELTVSQRPKCRIGDGEFVGETNLPLVGPSLSLQRVRNRPGAGQASPEFCRKNVIL